MQADPFNDIHRLVDNRDQAGNARLPQVRRRLLTHYRALREALEELYGDQHDVEALLKRAVDLCIDSVLQRPEDLYQRDLESDNGREWILENNAIGGVCYVDLYAGDFSGIEARIPYFRELGITYLHLMPLFECPDGKSDGGYAVSDYRAVNPELGTLEQLQALGQKLRDAGIRLVLDFIYNHTSDEHVWAKRARSGDARYRAFYHMFPDRTLPDAYEQNLREIFPEEAPGSFSWVEDAQAWVWTSFKQYQWDLNYANPDVFLAMAGEMLALANIGVEVLRLDAVAFAWKQLGTPCESLEPVYRLVDAFNAVARIAAPALLFKSEAIVHPDEVARYIGPSRCQLSYNPLLMALSWEALATRDTRLLTRSMERRFAVDPDSQWVNYIRCHDDIGWTFSDEDAAAVGINGFDHRQFLNAFYTGRFEGAFAQGVPFQFNPKTGDCRVCGSTASLAGLEKALRTQTGVEVNLAVGRVLLMYALIYGIGGIPLIYLGDELGLLNDYSYRTDPNKEDDSRWVQRPRFEPAMFALAKRPDSPQGRIFAGIKRLSRVRGATPALAGHQTRFIPMLDSALFSFVRESDGRQLLAIHNFSERQISIDAAIARDALGGPGWLDLLAEETLLAEQPMSLRPYQVRWLERT